LSFADRDVRYGSLGGVVYLAIAWLMQTLDQVFVRRIVEAN
jgi:hypothetical protein